MSTSAEPGRVDSDLLCLTQDEDFLFGEPVAAVIVLSRVRQLRRVQERTELWRTIMRELARQVFDDRTAAAGWHESLCAPPDYP